MVLDCRCFTADCSKRVAGLRVIVYLWECRQSTQVQRHAAAECLPVEDPACSFLASDISHQIQREDIISVLPVLMSGTISLFRSAALAEGLKIGVHK